MSSLGKTYLSMSDKMKLAFLKGKLENCEDEKVFKWLEVEIKETENRLKSKEAVDNF